MTGRRLAGVGRQEFVDARQRQRLRQAHAQQFVAPVAAQVPGHHLDPADRVDGRPGLGPHAGEPELRRQHRIGGEEGVDAGGVGLEQPHRFAVQHAQVRLRRAAHAERAQEPVGLQPARADDFGQAAGGHAPAHFHLPEAVLRVHEAEREARILQAGREDVRNAVAVAQDLDRAAEAGEADLALGLRQGLPQVEVGRRRSGRPKAPSGSPKIVRICASGEEYPRTSRAGPASAMSHCRNSAMVGVDALQMV